MEYPQKLSKGCRRGGCSAGACSWYVRYGSSSAAKARRPSFGRRRAVNIRNIAISWPGKAPNCPSWRRWVGAVPRAPPPSFRILSACAPCAEFFVETRRCGAQGGVAQTSAALVDRFGARHHRKEQAGRMAASDGFAIAPFHRRFPLCRRPTPPGLCLSFSSSSSSYSSPHVSFTDAICSNGRIGGSLAPAGAISGVLSESVPGPAMPPAATPISGVWSL
ncbi:hypothetical protein GQ53DRAFT_458515 [Thozetella sp. PMI_491]|nr:hypothetical protein GQ53DRAFT_458515 [Thozetella sp. PMI_491]